MNLWGSHTKKIKRCQNIVYKVTAHPNRPICPWQIFPLSSIIGVPAHNLYIGTTHWGNSFRNINIHISNCGYLNRYYTCFGISWRSFCGIIRAQAICLLPYKPNNHYVSKQFQKAQQQTLPQQPTPIVSRSSPQKLPENATVPEK
jgi:hypothetical protein